MKLVVDAFDNRPLIPVKDRNFIINPLTDHIPHTPYELLEDTVNELAKLTDYSKADKLLGEEERGGFITVLMAYHQKMPFGMVKWNPNGFDGQISVDFKMSYAEGKLYLNGINKGDKVIIVEDMIDSGGTMIAMIKLLEKAEVEIIDIIAIAEKEEYEGVKRIKKETGRDVKVLLRFSSKGEKSKVTWVRE
jgi:adenine/guanine phosphoribosyltransferase-like PRPP-binding protein